VYVFMWGGGRHEPTLTTANAEQEEAEYVAQHPMLAKVPQDYKLWIISKMNKGEGRFRYTFWLQKKDDRKVLLWYKGLQELYTALCDFSEEQEVGQQGEGGPDGVGGGMQDSAEFEQDGGCVQGAASEVGGRESGGRGGDAAPASAAAGAVTGDKQMGDGDGAEADESEGARELDLVLPTNWGRCCRLLKESDEFILKGEEKEEYLRLHPEIAPVPPAYTLHVVSKPVGSQARRQYTFWLQQKKDPRVLKHYNSISELSAILGPSERVLACKYCSKCFSSVHSLGKHEQTHLAEPDKDRDGDADDQIAQEAGGAAAMDDGAGTLKREEAEEGSGDGEGKKDGAEEIRGDGKVVGSGQVVNGKTSHDNVASFSVGDRVKVFWDGENTWFCGVVERTREGQVEVRYEDDDELHWEDCAAVLPAAPQALLSPTHPPSLPHRLSPPAASLATRAPARPLTPWLWPARWRTLSTCRHAESQES